jgi:hypothetical protein
VALAAESHTVRDLIAQFGKFGVWFDMMRRQATLALLALPAAVLANVAVALKYRCAPGKIFGILEALPRAAAFPEWMSRPSQDRAVLYFGLKNFLLRLLRHLSSKCPLSQLLSISLGENAASRVLALDFSMICRVFLQTKFACPPLNRSASDAKPLHQNNVTRHRIALAELLSYRRAKRIIFLQATHFLTCFRIPISCNTLYCTNVLTACQIE